MRVEVEHVLRVTTPKGVENSSKSRATWVMPSRVGRSVAVRHDEVYRRVGLGGGEDRVGVGLPLRPRAARIGLGVRDEPHAAGVKPSPVLATAAGSRRGSRRLRVGHDEPAFVVAEVPSAAGISHSWFPQAGMYAACW